MKITLKQLQVFVNTAKSESISIGAEKCFISQAAASMSLSQLESMLDTTLFDRVGKRMKLNDNGQNLLAKAIRILDEVSEFESFAVDNEHLSGKLIVGASTTLASYVLPKYLAQFKQKYPDVELEIINGNTKEIIHQVEMLGCDIGFVEGACDSQALDVELWRKDNLKVFCSINHPLAKKKKLSIKDILKYEWVTREAGSGTFDIFYKELGKDAKDLKQLMVLNNSEAIKQYVSHSDSLACLSQAILEESADIQKFKILKVDGLDLSREFYLLLNKKKYHTNLTKAFSDFIHSV